MAKIACAETGGASDSSHLVTRGHQSTSPPPGKRSVLEAKLAHQSILTKCSLSQYGYSLGSQDELNFGFEAMNMDEGERDVVLTMTWEFVVSTPKNFRKVRPYWFDVGGCKRSNMPAKPDSVFSYSSSPVKAPTSGIIAMAAAHLHDGGTKLEVTRQGKPFCVSRAMYDGGHIKKITTCDTLAYSKEDEFSITAHYNTTKHDPMTHPNGELEPVMGIALIYAVQDGSSKKHKKHLRRNIAVAAFSVAFFLTLLGLVWLRYQKKKNVSRFVLPAWLGRQYPNFQSGPVDGYQTLGETGDRVEYRD